MHRPFSHTLLRLLVWTVLLGLAPKAEAQIVLLDDEDIRIEADRLPVAGLPLELTASVFNPAVQPDAVFYRLTGTEVFQRISAVRDGAVYRFTFPAEALQVRGLEVYAQYFDEGELVTIPEPGTEVCPTSADECALFVPTLLEGFRPDLTLPPRQYRMVSVPADLGFQSVEDVLGDDLGEVNPARWRAAQWNPTLGRYEEAAGRLLPAGNAFWVITTVGGGFDVDGGESTSGETQTITLAPGQNQIGNPFAFPVAWSDIVADGDVDPPVAFDGVEYLFDQAVLEPWTGYFVTNRSGETVTLAVPPREVGVAPRAAAQGSIDYAVRLVAESGAYRDTQTLVGFAAEALIGRDGLDRLEPPPPGEHLGVSVREGSEHWARSVRPPSTDGAFWDIEIAATDGLLSDGARRVTVELSETGTRPSAFGLWVIDRDLGTALALENGTFDVTLSPSAPVRRLRVIAGTEAFAEAGSDGAPLLPSAFGLDAGFPNPSAGTTTIRYRLAARGQTMLEVIDVLGRRVRVLADAAHDAGEHTASWDGRDGAGRPVASGTYLVRLRTADASVARRVSIVR